MAKHRLFDYESLFDWDLQLSKRNRSLFAAGSPDHALALVGVDLDDGNKNNKNQQPIKWLADNSWGDKMGKDGKWTLFHDWFTEHVYAIVVRKAHLAPKTRVVFEQQREATPLPPWYPGCTVSL